MLNMRQLIEKIKTFMWKHETKISWIVVLSMVAVMICMLIAKEIFM